MAGVHVVIPTVIATPRVHTLARVIWNNDHAVHPGVPLQIQSNVVYLAGTPEVRARSEQTLVCVDMESFRPTSIPGRCRDAFESILAPVSETP